MRVTESPSHVATVPAAVPAARRAPDPRIATIWTALSLVIDPELGLDVVALGLVYDVGIVSDAARVTHTLTTPGCPMERIITQGIRDAVSAVEGITRVETRLVWEPAWHPGMISRDAWER